MPQLMASSNLSLSCLCSGLSGGHSSSYMLLRLYGAFGIEYGYNPSFWREWELEEIANTLSHKES